MQHRLAAQIAWLGMDLDGRSGDTRNRCNYFKEVIQMSSGILLVSDQPLGLNRIAGETPLSA